MQPETELAHGGERGRVALPCETAEVVLGKLVAKKGGLAELSARFVEVTRNPEAICEEMAQVADGLELPLTRGQAR